MSESALTESIDHWKQNASITHIKDAVTGSGSCALCNVYFDNDCKGCPVYRRVKLKHCQQTPYTLAYRAVLREDLPDFLIHAQAEIEFLESLHDPHP